MTPLPRWLPVLAALMMAAVLGAATPVLEGRMLLLVAALAPLPLIFWDYRIGVLLLALVLPVATMLPPIRGLNVVNFLTLATLASFTLRAAFAQGATAALRGQASGVTWLPSRLVWGFWLPTTLGILIAWPHIPEGVRNYPDVENAREIYEPMAYAINRYVKPILYYFSFAFLLANAVRHSRRPEGFIALLAFSALLPAFAVMATVAVYPGSFAQLAQDREFMAPRGMHANEFGMQLALASGPLLFVAGGGRQGGGSRALRLLAGASFCIVTLALLLTFSRGGLLAWLIGVGAFLVYHRRVKTMLVSAVAVAVFLLAAPDALQDRFSTGLREGALSDTSNVSKDDLTAGRVYGWTLLAPEVLESPWVGSGLGSTQWSQAVALGRYKADHPHNIYLEVLMDLGLFGFAAFVWVFVGHLRRYRTLAVDPALHPDMRSFFMGSRFALWGMLVMAATTAYYMPKPAQVYLWFSLGLAFADWRPRSATAPLAAAGRSARPAQGAAPVRARSPSA